MADEGSGNPDHEPGSGQPEGPGEGELDPENEPGTPDDPLDEVDSTPEISNLYRHPLAAVGGALIVAGGLGFAILSFLDLTAESDNPYRSLISWVALPSVVLVGIFCFLLAIRLQVMAARRRGETIRFRLLIEPSNPKYVRSLWTFIGLAGLFVLLIGYTGFKGYEATDSTSFCADTCHEVMGPEGTTYENSPHARVLCVECHIGPGGSFWVRSKVDGVRQLFATVLNTYRRPIETPVHSLRPAQQTCEGCHWPQQFYGEKLVTHQYFDSDEENSPWMITLLVRIGGGNPRTGELEGIHWHMVGAHRVEYIANDEKREDIDWVRLIDADGIAVVFTDPTLETPINPNDPAVEIRTFDCIDCHNRPSHTFVPPATSINLALSTNRISADLPYVRAKGIELLNAEYLDSASAHRAIRDGLSGFYASSYPDRFETMRDAIEQAIVELQRIYDANFFPGMKTDYRAHLNNVSHFLDPGCFRCHDGHLQNRQGEVLVKDCNACHLIVAQGPTTRVDDLVSNFNGQEFQHPGDVGDLWKSINCSDCHASTHEYTDVECITCHPNQAGGG